MGRKTSFCAVIVILIASSIRAAQQHIYTRDEQWTPWYVFRSSTELFILTARFTQASRAGQVEAAPITDYKRLFDPTALYRQLGGDLVIGSS
ncbi:MAG: hypothetical protein WB660_06735 [Candidatus Sulfotelmatobacter sp.]